MRVFDGRGIGQRDQVAYTLQLFERLDLTVPFSAQIAAHALLPSLLLIVGEHIARGFRITKFLRPRSAAIPVRSVSINRFLATLVHTRQSAPQLGCVR